MKSIVLTFVCAVLPTLLAAEIRLPAVISDHMVLQQQADVRLWGEAAPDSKVPQIRNRPHKMTQRSKR